MIGQLPPKRSSEGSHASRRVMLAAATAGIAVLMVACGANYFEIPIETPIQPKLDVSAFQRVLVAEFARRYAAGDHSSWESW